MKKIVTKYPGKIIISNYELGDCLKLERSLSIWDPVIFKVVFEGFKYNENSRSLIIPSGYNLNYLETIFTEEQIQYEIINNEDNIYPYREVYFSLKYPSRSSLQNQAISFLMKSGRQKFLSLETGGGKTYCAIHYVFKSKKLPITFVDQLTIADQWCNRIQFFTNINKDEIYIISGRNSIDKILNMEQKELGKYKWFIAIHRTLANYSENEGELKLNNLFKKIGIGVRLYDEAHVEFKNIFNMDRAYNCESVYITATPVRGNPYENKVYQNMFSTFSVPRFIGKDENYHNILIYAYDTKPDVSDEAALKTKYGFNTNGWNSYIFNEKYDIFMDSLTEVLDTVYKKNTHKTAILISSIELCNKSYNDFKEYLKEKNLTVGVYHSKIKNKDSELKKDVIFTTEKSFGKAIDIPGLSVCINTVPCSSEGNVLQIIGRLRYIEDKEVFFIDMYDKGFNMQCKQASRRFKIYKKKAKKIIKINKK